MKRTALCLLAVGFLWFQGNVFAQPPAILLATGEWAPYASQSMEDLGVFTEIVSAAFHEMGMEPRYTFYPWKRAEQMVEKGEVLAAFPYKITTERKQMFDFSDPVMLTTGQLFYLKKNFPNGITYNTYKDLAPYKIGGVIGYWYETVFKQANLNVEYVPSDTQNIHKLYRNRIQLTVSDELVGWALIKSLYPQEISLFAVAEKPLNRDELRLMISREYPFAAKLTENFNAALVRLRKKGMVSKILEKYEMRQRF